MLSIASLTARFALRASKLSRRASRTISRSWVTSSGVELKTMVIASAKASQEAASTKGSWFQEFVTKFWNFSAARLQSLSTWYLDAAANTLACVTIAAVVSVAAGWPPAK